MAEKEHWWRHESITACPKEEDAIPGDSEENPFNEKPKKQRYQWRCAGASEPSMTLALQINSFWLFGNGMW